MVYSEQRYFGDGINSTILSLQRGHLLFRDFRRLQEYISEAERSNIVKYIQCLFLGGFTVGGCAVSVVRAADSHIS